MNDIIRNILTRRSIRKYRPDPVAKEILDQILQAGLYAPSARNKQPWHLTAVSGQAPLARLTAEVKAATLRANNHYVAMVSRDGYSVGYGAPTLVIVSGDPSDAPMAPYDCALVLGTMFLAAHSLGIGSCWINQLGIVSDEPGFRAVLDTLGVPSGNTVYGCASLGYAEGPHPAAAARRDGVVNYVNG